MIIYQLIICHMFGDYFLQTDYIAKMKGKDNYILLIHCLLYTIPFYIMFGFSWIILVIIVTHFIIDILKARYKKTNIFIDQILHYIVLALYLI